METQAEQIITTFPHRHILNDDARNQRLQFIADNFGIPSADSIEGLQTANTTSIPIGLAGPLNLNDDYQAYFPLATTEGALVASYTRGLRVLNKSMETEVHISEQKITAYTRIPAEVLKQQLHTTATDFYRYWLCSYTGISMAKSKANHGHFSNGITALLLALNLPLSNLKQHCFGNTIVKEIEGDIHIQISLHNPINIAEQELSETTRKLLPLICLPDKNIELGFHRAIALLTLAGEISIMAAMAAGHFASAHKKLRKQSA